MARVKGETDENDLLDVFQRMVTDVTEVEALGTEDLWRNYLSELTGINLQEGTAKDTFFQDARTFALSQIGVNVTFNDVTGQTLFRVPKGEPGAGQFMSVADVQSRLAAAQTVSEEGL